MKYKIMHKGQIIAYADDNVITEITKKEFCPACFYIGMPLEIWFNTRVIDLNRSNSTILLKSLGLNKNVNMKQLIDVGHGISITDNWWVQKIDDHLDYRMLRCYKEDFSYIAYSGNQGYVHNIIPGYKELGTVGKSEKAWQFIDYSWYMLKRGNTKELFSEYYSYLFLKAMGANVADFFMPLQTEYHFLKVKDFTGNAVVDFEPLYNYFGNADIYDIICNLDRKLLIPYVMMLFYDALLFNINRDNENVGVLRNSNTGEIIGLAPYFDYNESLISVEDPTRDAIGGSILLRHLLRNDISNRILKEKLPERERVVNAIRFASDVTKSIFKEESFNYTILKRHILYTFDGIDKFVNESDDTIIRKSYGFLDSYEYEDDELLCC